MTGGAARWETPPPGRHGFLFRMIESRLRQIDRDMDVVEAGLAQSQREIDQLIQRKQELWVEKNELVGFISPSGYVEWSEESFDERQRA